MSTATPAIRISRYPNRRFYDHSTSSYVSLENIEELVTSGKMVEIRDSQTDEDLTRAVLTRIIIERQPDKMQLFPVDMLHFIVPPTMSCRTSCAIIFVTPCRIWSICNATARPP